ncbi:hypothetical protein HY212_04310 [Candidatus Pacearchaeota archaeon]|nr:hypothetical protein [Candidatus Pacearchaeota archaeon]
MTLTTALGREGYGFAEAKNHNQTPEARAPGVYSPKSREPFSRDIVTRIAQLERILRDGNATAEEVEHLECLRYMMYEGPFGC